MTNNFSIDKHIGNEIYLIWYADILRPLESIEITKVVNIKLFSPLFAEDAQVCSDITTKTIQPFVICGPDNCNTIKAKSFHDTMKTNILCYPITQERKNNNHFSRINILKSRNNSVLITYSMYQPRSFSQRLFIATLIPLKPNRNNPSKFTFHAMKKFNTRHGEFIVGIEHKNSDILSDHIILNVI
ncbi:hypothetical protein U3516DRAFT_741725 [Neocallimastix sp. 'constans']